MDHTNNITSTIINANVDDDVLAVTNLSEVNAVVLSLCASVCIFSLMCEIYPVLVTRWNSNAWSAQLTWNIGLPAFEFQAVMYELYHRTRFCRMCHWTIISDCISWYYIIYNITGKYFIVIEAFTCLLVLQCRTFGNTRLTSCSFIFFHLVVLLVIMIPGGVSSTYAAYIIASGAMLRTLGHALAEVTPPIMFDGDKPQHRFRVEEGLAFFVVARYSMKSAKHALVVVRTTFVGWISEVQAGLPWRLLFYTLYIMVGMCFNFTMSTNGVEWETSPQKIKDIRNIIWKDGWNSWMTTDRLYSNSDHDINAKDVKKVG